MPRFRTRDSGCCVITRPNVTKRPPSFGQSWRFGSPSSVASMRTSCSGYPSSRWGRIASTRPALARRLQRSESRRGGTAWRISSSSAPIDFGVRPSAHSMRRLAASTLTASGNLAPRTFSNSSAGPSVFASRQAISVTSYCQSTSRVTRLRSPRRSHSARKSDSVRKPVIWEGFGMRTERTRSFGEQLEISEVPRATERTLVTDEIALTDEGTGHAGEITHHAATPGFFECQARERRQHIDAAWRNSNLEHEIDASQIGFRQIAERRSKRSKRAIDTGSIVGGRIDPDIEIAGGARTRVKCDCVRADDEVTRLSGGQLAQ